MKKSQLSPGMQPTKSPPWLWEGREARQESGTAS